VHRIVYSATLVAAVMALLLTSVGPAQAGSHTKRTHGADGSGGMMGGGPRAGLLMPMMSAERGRKLFAAKGCVVCHALNGVGGDHGSNLNMSAMGPMNPFEFAAKMWRGAEAMIILQREELGEAIELNGQELADIIAFVHSPDEVAKFTEADIPHRIIDVLKKTHGEDTDHPHAEGKGHPRK